MTGQALLGELRGRRVTVSLEDGGQLALRGAGVAQDVELLAWVREAKPELIVALQAEQVASWHHEARSAAGQYLSNGELQRCARIACASVNPWDTRAWLGHVRALFWALTAQPAWLDQAEKGGYRVEP